MGFDLPKTTASLGGFSLSGTQTIVWKFITGTDPYVTEFSVLTDDWRSLRSKMGQPLELVITDRKTAISIKDLYILHEAPSDIPERTNFVVADKRWKWDRGIVSRDYNIVKRTGHRTTLSNVPHPGSVTRDAFEYKPYSLKDGKTKWTPKDAVEDILKQIHEESASGAKSEPDVKVFGKTSPRKRIGGVPVAGSGKGGGSIASGDGWTIDSFPLKDPVRGQFSLQNLAINDPGNVALARLLSAIPGADVWVDAEGMTRVFDAADLAAAEKHFNSLPPSTRRGEDAVFVHRKAIRPSKVIVYFMREVEILTEYADDYDGQTSVDRADPYLENVIPTPDLTTELTSYEPETGAEITRTVPRGSWVPVRQWLTAMEKRRKTEGILTEPWTFDTIRQHWLGTSLDSMLGGGGKQDVDKTGSIQQRIDALKLHFRTTFRINRRYMERIRKLTAERVGVLEHMSGDKAPSEVWGQITIIPSGKGANMRDAARKKGEDGGLYRMLDTLPNSGANVATKPWLPLRVSMINAEIGIFRLEFVAHPFGTDSHHVPSHLVYKKGGSMFKQMATRLLQLQEKRPTGDGFHIEGYTNAQLLAADTEFKVMLTMIPGAPNNKSRYHAIEVTADDIADLYQGEYRIRGGSGPPLEIYVPPQENTARFAWDDDSDAKATMIRLLGMKDDDPNTAGLRDDPKTKGVDESQMKGFLLTNGEKGQGQLEEDARSRAAEALAAFADSLEGDVATRLPAEGVSIKGNMASAGIQIATSPSAQVTVTHEFPGKQRLIGRMAFLPNVARLEIDHILPLFTPDVR